LCLTLTAVAEPPPFLKVQVNVQPRGARFLCGISLEKSNTPGRLKVKHQQLPASGDIELRLGQDYSAYSQQIAVGVDAPGYAPYVTNVSLERLVAGQPGPVALFESPVRLKPVSLAARMRESPWIPALAALMLAIGVGTGLRFWRRRGERRAQLRREQRLDKLGLKREGLVGTVVDGLQILDEIGAGGMGTVFRVEPVDKPGQFLALKVLDQGTGDPRFVERFHREVTVTARLSHPRLILLYRAVEADGLLGLLMELVQGHTLRREVRQGGQPMDKVLEWIGGMAEGLFYAHQQGVVHRDLKPDNVMVTPQGKIKLMDFGIARHASGAKLSETRSITGTVDYMAPEQIEGGPVTPALDQYAVGIMVYELLTGQVPYRAESPFDTFRLHLQAPVPDVLQLRPDLPPGVGVVLQRMLAKKPEDRFGDMERAMRTLRHAWTTKK
jgi:hypothetical protein